VSPTGTATSGCPTRDVPACDLGAAAANAVAGDTVILTDGVYQRGIWVANSGTADAWITFKADDCSMPVIQGPGVGPMEDNQDTGVGSDKAQYVRFIGIVSRGWSTGFGNGWTGNVAQDSNGNWEIINCIGDWNGRTGFTFFSASNFRVKNSISAHNGSSVAHSWSSGMTLYSAGGTNVIEGNVSFENMDAEQHTDGSGFIVDESSNNATFVNNVAFRNGGSCLRLTRSSGTKFINNTCYHNAQDSMDQGPTNPGEIYFTAATDNSTVTNVQFVNNALVNTGTGPGADAVLGQPTTGWSNNAVKPGTVAWFTGAETDYTLASGAMADLVGKGTASGAPMTDIGFDPKCLTKTAPTPIGMMAKASWWQHSIDYDYIKSIGGVASCFNPKARSGTPDIGAYANGAVTTKAVGNCTPPPPPPPPVSTGGAAGMGGISGAGGANPGAGTGGTGVSAGGAPGTGGTGNPAAGAPATGGTGVLTGGAAGMATGGGAPNGTGGTGSPAAGSGTVATGGTNTGAGGATGSGAAGGAPATGGSSSAGGGNDGDDKSGCGCRVGGDAPNGGVVAALGALGVALFSVRRRRRVR
jgi:MYXO-CTERM domain-containing protein